MLLYRRWEWSSYWSGRQSVRSVLCACSEVSQNNYCLLEQKYLLHHIGTTWSTFIQMKWFPSASLQDAPCYEMSLWSVGGGEKCWCWHTQETIQKTSSQVSSWQESWWSWRGQSYFPGNLLSSLRRMKSLELNGSLCITPENHFIIYP